MKKFLALCLIGLVVALASPAPAEDTVYAFSTNTLSTNAVAASTRAAVTSQPFLLSSGTGIGLYPQFTGGTNVAGVSDSAGVIFEYQVTGDTNSWPSTTQFTNVLTAVSNQVVRGYTGLAPSAVPGARWGRLWYVNNLNTNSIGSVVLKNGRFYR